MFWELEKAIIGPEKDKWWIWGSKTPKPPEMPIKLGKTSQHHNWPGYMDWPQIGPKIAIEQGEKPHRAPTPPPPQKNKLHLNLANILTSNLAKFQLNIFQYFCHISGSTKCPKSLFFCIFEARYHVQMAPDQKKKR